MKLRPILPLLGLALATASPSFAAGPDKTSPALFDTPAINARGRALQEADAPQLAAARSALASGNLDETEILLGGIVRAEPGSAGWHRGMAGQLVQLATATRKAESGTARAALLRKAELHLTEAYRKSQTPRQQAAVQVALGALYERQLADPAKAREAYDKAARLAPDFPPATESSERLRRADAYYRKQRSAGSR